MTKVLALIPARSGSKRIKNKNIKPLMGKPLIAYSILQALESKFIDKVMSVQIAKNMLKFREIVGLKSLF